MKTIKKTKNKNFKIIGYIVAILLVIAAASSCYVYIIGGNIFGWQANKPSNSSETTINMNPATDQEIDAGSKTKQDSVNKDLPNKTTNDLVVTISALNQTKSTLQIRYIIDTVSDNGLCKLTLTQSAEVITKTSAIQALPNTSTCKGFDIPITELSSGKWDISVEASIGDKKGVIKTSTEIK